MVISLSLRIFMDNWSRVPFYYHSFIYFPSHLSVENQMWHFTFLLEMVSANPFPQYMHKHDCKTKRLLLFIFHLGAVYPWSNDAVWPFIWKWHTDAWVTRIVFSFFRRDLLRQTSSSGHAGRSQICDSNNIL